MPAQLDILALEPFYGGARRVMLHALTKCSRHRWTLLTLPPRRIERRLSAAANWFAEQLCQHFSGHVDVLFTSEAMNLASLLRRVPDLSSRPSVVYFHEDHLPPVDAREEGAFDAIDLGTASAATEIWFNSNYHLDSFISRGCALVARHANLTQRDPMPVIRARARLVVPPDDFGFVDQVRAAQPVQRDPNAIFVETRDADVRLLNAALRIAREMGCRFRLITVGPAEGLSHDWPRKTIRENDEFGKVLGMLESSVLVSVRSRANSDYLCIRGLLAGCRAAVPNAGVYPELLPPRFGEVSLYQPEPQTLARRIAAALKGDGWPTNPPDWRRVLRAFDAVHACRLIDERLNQLAQASADTSGPKSTQPPYVP